MTKDLRAQLARTESQAARDEWDPKADEGQKVPWAQLAKTALQAKTVLPASQERTVLMAAPVPAAKRVRSDPTVLTDLTDPTVPQVGPVFQVPQALPETRSLLMATMVPQVFLDLLVTTVNQV